MIVIIDVVIGTIAKNKPYNFLSFNNLCTQGLKFIKQKYKCSSSTLLTKSMLHQFSLSILDQFEMYLLENIYSINSNGGRIVGRGGGYTPLFQM